MTQHDACLVRQPAQALAESDRGAADRNFRRRPPYLAEVSDAPDAPPLSAMASAASSSSSSSSSSAAAAAAAGRRGPSKRKSDGSHPDPRPKRPALAARDIAESIQHVLDRCAEFRGSCEAAFRTWATDDSKPQTRCLSPPPPRIFLCSPPIDVPDIPVMACPWTWMVYRGARLVVWQKASRSKSSETRGGARQQAHKARKTVDKASRWKTFEMLGDGTLRNIFRDTFARLDLPAPMLSRLDQSFNCNQLWQEWCANIPDLDQFSGRLRADSFEVTCPCSVLGFIH